MSKRVIALLDTDEAVNEAVDKLGKEADQGEDDAFDWRLVQYDRQSSRIVPMYGSFATLTAPTGAGPAMGGAIVQDEAPAEQFATEFDLSREEAQYFAQGLRHGGHVAIIDAPDGRVDEAYQLLEALGGQGIITLD